MGVTVNYAGVNNDETRDAFFKTVDVTVTGDMSVDVTLKRPFAQINVGCTTDDWNAAQASNINVKTSAVTIKDAATKLNVIDGTVSGNQDVTYAAANIPTETLKGQRHHPLGRTAGHPRAAQLPHQHRRQDTLRRGQLQRQGRPHIRR